MNATPGRRLFIVSCIVLLLFGCTHLVTVVRSKFVPLTDPLQIEADRAMQAVTIDMGPFHTNAAMLMHLLSASYSTLLLGLASINLVALRGAIAQRRFRALTIVNILIAGVLLTITIIYQFPPPMVFSLTATVLFIGSLIRQGRSTPAV